jgi:enamine deaminase RidA (YjgF/YER057c/UK114 family)
MDEDIAARLARIGVELPVAAAPAANYLPYVLHGGLLYISGQLPMAKGSLTCRGIVGESVTVDQAREAARLCAINILAQAKAALDGDLERIVRIVRITGYVASTASFAEQHIVMNAASDLLAEALGERGRHARAAVGMAALPLGAAVEVDAIIAVA